jgi:hypothetical protein
MKFWNFYHLKTCGEIFNFVPHHSVAKSFANVGGSDDKIYV